MLCHTMSCYVTPCHAVPSHAMPCYAMPCSTMLCHVMLCHVAPFEIPTAIATQAVSDRIEFNEQTSSNTVYLLWICHSSLLGVAHLFRSRLNLPLRRRLLRSLVPTQKNPSTQTQLPLLGVGFCPCTLLRRSRGVCKEFLVISLTYWQTKSVVQVGHCRRI